MAEVLQTLVRGIQVLKYLAGSAQPVSIHEIASQFDLHRTAAYRLMTSLESEDLVRQVNDARWQVDARAALLVPPSVRSLESGAVVVLTGLATALQQTASLTVAQGDVCMALEVCPPPGTGFHIGHRAGTTHPIDRGAAGLAILANEDPLPDERDVVSQFRAQKYAISLGELEPNTFGYAAALPTDHVRASIGIIALNPLEESDFLELLQQASRDLAAHVDKELARMKDAM